MPKWLDRIRMTKWQRDVAASLGRIEAHLGTLKRTGETTMATVQDVQARVDSMAGQVEQTRDAVAAVEQAEAVQIQLIKDLRDQIANGTVVPDEIVARMDETLGVMESNKARLAQLAVANTQG